MRSEIRSGWFVVADDATGALEAGALLAGLGLPGRVVLAEAGRGASDWPAGVWLLATRHLGAEEARGLLRAALGPLAGRAETGCAHDGALYWKTDSTLRGPIGACFDALLGLWPGRPLVYVPAYPALGRTVENGVLRVAGVPVAETEFGQDARNPVPTSDVVKAVAGECGFPVERIASAGALAERLAAAEGARSRSAFSGCDGVLVCDAVTEWDVAALLRECRRAAERSKRWPLVAGPAGGIRPWAGAADAVSTRPVPVSPEPVGAVLLGQVRRWVLLNGSRHPRSRQQAQAARELGVPVFAMPDEPLADAGAVLHALARATLATGADGIIVFGGDTALALWQAMGISNLEARGEILPGVAVSQAEDRTFVTKAGGFGAPDLVETVLGKGTG